MPPWPAWVAEADPDAPGYTVPGIDWIIVGGESGRDARPFDLDWGLSVVRQAAAAGVPVFVKQLGSMPMLASSDGTRKLPFPTRHKKGEDMAEFPPALRVREQPTPRPLRPAGDGS